MRKITSALCAAAMALPLMVVSPASSTPISMMAPLVQQGSGASVVDVQYRRHHRNYRPSRKHHRPRYNRYRRNHNRDVAAGVLGGLAAGAIIGGMMNNQPSYNHNVPPRNYHVEWCINRYRSYDVRNDTFQPYDGPRRRCISPYR